MMVFGWARALGAATRKLATPKHGARYLLRKHAPGVATGAVIVGGGVGLDATVNELTKESPPPALPEQMGEQDEAISVSDSSWNLFKIDSFTETEIEDHNSTDNPHTDFFNYETTYKNKIKLVIMLLAIVMIILGILKMHKPLAACFC